MTLRSYAMHVYTYLDGDDDIVALQDLVRICAGLGMHELPPRGPQGVRTAGPEARRSFGGLTDRGIYQAIEYNTARLTALLVCLVPHDGRTWCDLDSEWSENAGSAATADCVGRVRLYYALYEGNGAVERLAGLARDALPVRADPANRVELFAGCHLWELDAGEDHRRDRTFVLLAPARQEQRSDDWVWPGGTYRLPPLPGYLWEMAKVRHEGHRFEERRRRLYVQELTARAARLEAAERPKAWIGGIRDRELRTLRHYTALASAGAAALRTMHRTVQAAAGDAAATLDSAGRTSTGNTGPFAADRGYVDWLLVEMADEADTADDAVRYAGPLAGLASAVAEERLTDLRERGQVLKLVQTSTIATIGLVLAAVQAIGYDWPTYASTQTPFMFFVAFLGLFLPLAASRPSGRYVQGWRACVGAFGIGLAASSGWLLAAWFVRWRTGRPAPAQTSIDAAAAGGIAAMLIFVAWLLITLRKKERG